MKSPASRRRLARFSVQPTRAPTDEPCEMETGVCDQNTENRREHLPGAEGTLREMFFRDTNNRDSTRSTHGDGDSWCWNQTKSQSTGSFFTMCFQSDVNARLDAL